METQATHDANSVLRGKPLETYLNDHLAGSTGGLELARKMVHESNDASERTVLEDIAREIEEERVILKDTIRVLSCKESSAKKVVGWLAEKAAAVKLNPALHDPGLTRILEFEALSTGVAGKRCLWQNLNLLRSKDERLEPFNYASLQRLAEAQLARLDSLRERLV
jgi:hypothetical protein